MTDVRDPHSERLAPDPAASLGKPGLLVVPDEALNVETPATLLDEAVTPVSRFFVRNNGEQPALDEATLRDWTLTIDGEVERPLRLGVRELRERFETVTLTAVLECAGNSRRTLAPATPGLQWGPGAVGCARWTGVRLADLLAEARPTDRAVYTAHHSPDREIGGRGPALSRGLPLWKARAPETLVAFGMNGADLGPLHGAPLRIVAPGFPGSAWQKWLRRIEVRDREHDGMKMTGYDYRLPVRRLRPGELPPPSEMAVIESMPIKSVVTRPGDEAVVHVGDEVVVAGFAWSGHRGVAAVDVSVDGGRSWRAAALAAPAGPFAWTPFRLAWRPERAGDVEIVARATDASGTSQPVDEAPWNPNGYANNLCQRVRVRVA